MPTKMAEKNAGSTTCGNEELVFLANAIKEGRKRRLKMQLALNNLAARRRRVFGLPSIIAYFPKEHHTEHGIQKYSLHVRQVYFVVLKQEEHEPSSFPAILFEWFEGFRAWHVSELS